MGGGQECARERQTGAAFQPLDLLHRCPSRCCTAAQRGFEATADVAVVGPGLKVLDADLAFEVWAWAG